jgi:TolA-binding protein
MNLRRIKSWMVVFGLVIFSCGLIAEGRKWLIRDHKWIEVEPPEPGTPEGDLEIAKQLFATGEIGKAEDAVESWLKTYPDSPLTGAALFLKGDIEMKNGRLHNAFKNYEQVLDQYAGIPEWETALEREYEIAERYFAGEKRRFLGMPIIDARPDAVEILTRIHERHPESNLAQRALMRLANYYYNQHYWSDAEATYQLVVTGYPQSPYRLEAMRRSAEAAMNRYHGPAYDDSSLLDARARYEAYRDEGISQEERAKVNAILNDIEAKRAEKYIVIADLYKRLGKERSEAVYLQELVERWPDSPAAGKARNRLARLEPREQGIQVTQ